MKSRVYRSTLTIEVAQGQGSGLINVQGVVTRTAIKPPGTGASYDLSVTDYGFGIMGKEGLLGYTTVAEDYVCVTGSSINIFNALTDGSYEVCLFGELWGR